MFGIDVSHHQGNIDWEKVKSQIDFAILKVGNSGDNKKFWADTSFERNYAECTRLNIPIGIYVYCYSNEIENVKEAARELVKYLKGKHLQLPVYIDMEDKEIKLEGKDKLTNICIAFNTIMEEAGFWAGIYANADWFKNYLNADLLKSKYTCWIAHYTFGTEKYKGEYDMWQNSSNGEINGINGNVDTNYLYRNLIAEIRNTKESAPVLPKKSVNEIVEEVLAGQWGNGKDRKTRLNAAGYNYETIQSAVNNKLSKPKEIIYIVQKGDTLSKIAVKYNTTYQKIAKKNGISNPDKIYIGQKLKI